MTRVLDACAMIAYLRGEPGADEVASLLLNQDIRCLAHAVNLCEVYYDFMRTKNEQAAETAIADLQAVGVVIRDDMNTEFWQQAGRYKAEIKASH